MEEYLSSQKIYSPAKPQIIFIAEAPPCDTSQFFYYTVSAGADNLFLHTIRAVFPDMASAAAADIKKNKERLLARFASEGFLMEFASMANLPKGMTAAQKIKHASSGTDTLTGRIAAHKASAALVLISATVYKGLYKGLETAGFQVLNNTAVPYPGSGQQANFRREINALGIGV
jgi:hypothetical protein